MKKKILLLFTLLLLFIPILTSCGKSAAPAKEETIEDKFGEYKPKMWIVTDKEGSNKIYLLGSIHVGIKKMYPMPEEIEKAFKESKVLAVENNVVELENDIDFTMELLGYFACKEGTTLKDYLSKENLDELTEIFKEFGYVVNGEQLYMPIFYYSLLDELIGQKSIYKSSNGVDRYFLDRAIKDGMTVKEIEDAKHTYSLLGGISSKTQEIMISESIKSYREKKKDEDPYEILIKYWVNGDLDKYWQENMKEADEMNNDDKNAALEYIDRLLVQRNNIMTDKVIEYLKTDEVHFYVVGAAHYLDDYGIIKQLEKKGYTVKEAY